MTINTQALNEFSALLGDRLSQSDAVCEHHGTDMAHHGVCPPDAVAFPHTTQEVSEIVKICAKYKVPLTAFGTGTSLEGHILALDGGLSVDLMGLNRIVGVRPEDLDVTVEAGVTREDLNHHLRDKGLFFPIDPGANASLGGMAATRASGTNAVRYGTMRENILSLTVVMADGRIIRTGGRARKSAAGYDLTRLLVGSEGTLGIITEITLRLQGIPEAMSAAICHFDTLDQAVKSVVQVIQCGIPIARIELIDELQMELINRYSDLDYPLKPTLFMEFHGSGSSVREQAEMVQDITNGRDFQWAVKTEDRNRLWKARHDAYHSVKAANPGMDIWVTDVCVPISRLTQCILDTKEDIKESGLFAPIVGHVGDGNFHLTIAYDGKNRQAFKNIEAFSDRLVQRALDLEGTCTGEHGVGIGKKKYLAQEFGEGLDIMRQIKRTLDPDNILNPHKIFDLE